MSLMSKKNNMKSTLKIDLDYSGSPVIKIVQPVSMFDYGPQDDIDPKDMLIKNFLHHPLSVDRHSLFTLNTYFPVPFENTTHHITTIRPITHQEILKDLKLIVQNQFKNENLSGEQSDKIDGFFSWLKEETQE